MKFAIFIAAAVAVASATEKHMNEDE
jgi:hypothetical protein